MLCQSSSGLSPFHSAFVLLCALQFQWEIVETKSRRWNERVNPYEQTNHSDTVSQSARQLRTNLWFRDGNQFRSTYDYRHYGPRKDWNSRRRASVHGSPTKTSTFNVQMDAGSIGLEEARGSLFWAPQGHRRDNQAEQWDYTRETRHLGSQRSIRMYARTESPRTKNYIPEDTYPQRMIWNEQGQFWGYAPMNRHLVNDQAYGDEQLMVPYDAGRAQMESDSCIPPFCIPIDCGETDTEGKKCRSNRVTLSCSGTDCDPRCSSTVQCVQNDLFTCTPGTYGPECRVLNASRCWQEHSIICAFGCTRANDTEATLRCVCNPWSTDPTHNQTCTPVLLDVFLCPRGCSARGRCDVETKQCLCHSGYSGPACERELSVCPSGLTGPGCKQDIDECLSGGSGCEQRCLNEFGTFRCACNEGYEIDPQNPKRCVRVGENCHTHCPTGQGDCSVENKCVCRPGYEGQWCDRDIDECIRGLHKCDQVCVNTVGSYECRCHTGYAVSPENPHWCTPVGCEPQCVMNQGTCGPDRHCQCKPGFTGIDCSQDVNECTLGSHQCEQECVNTYGSYYCTCRSGYKPFSKDPNRCGLDVCDPACTEQEGHCKGRICLNNGVCRVVGDNETQCTCPPGYEGTLCERDTDECAQNPCDHFCFNTPGSYLCACQPGYQLQSDKKTCVQDITDLCGDGCLNGGICVAGNRCECPRGFGGERCEKEQNPCHYTNECEHLCIPNRNGTFRCDCLPGYQLSPDGRSCTTSLGCLGGCENGGQCFRGRCLCRSGFQGARCELDQDECSLPTAAHGCTFQCVNTHGSYECVCPPHYRRLDDKRTCVRTPEEITCNPPCQNGGVCRENGRCECLRGYQGADCSVDVDECARLKPCDPDFAECRNTPGSFECVCRPGYRLMLDGRHCIEDSRAQHAPHLIFRGRGQKGIELASRSNQEHSYETRKRTNEPSVVTSMRRLGHVTSRRLRRKAIVPAIESPLSAVREHRTRRSPFWTKGDLGRSRTPTASFTVYRTRR
ncbi:Neurogenic locus notch protein 3 [Fasciola hepatica]|uniref:Neurogenic locus notch protein 3 n=1 Tax=Fasciola hepatica TaxID=6192 RepID=A0A4E0RN21_FASHE|nr:Neurogenic locus notch protein 3 [Fasciola hepatica]